jgi:4-amino-4-deoxy-L-arabinose transferase-like glycosyltransferase
MVMVLSLFLNLEAGDPTLMEARNFVTAREMTENGNWLLPTMNGHLRLAKPPLPTWMTTLAGLGFGNIEYLPALRFPAALMGALWVLFTFLLARQLTADLLIPFLAAVVLATSFAFVQAARQGTWDIYCHSFMSGAIWLFVWGCRRNQTSYGIFLLCGLLLGCSFLSKGPVSFYALLLPFLAAWYRGFGLQALKRKRKEIAAALLLGILAAIAWPMYVFLKVPQQLAASAALEGTAWMERHVRPFWFYWSFPVETGIWTLFAAAALVAPYARPRIARFGNYRFLATWVILAVILLSVIPEKKERYLLPVLMPLALLTGHYLRYLAGAFTAKKFGRVKLNKMENKTLLVTFGGKKYSRADHNLVAAQISLLTLVIMACPYLIYRFVYQNHFLTLGQGLAVSAWILILGAGLLFFFQKRRFDCLLLAMVMLQVTVFVIGIPPYQGRHLTHKNYQGLKAVRHLEAVKHLDFYALGGMPMEYIWEVGRPVDSFQVKAPVPLLPEKLPAALFSTAPLAPTAFSNKNLDLREIGNFYYRKEDPTAVYYLYILSTRPKPAIANP